MAFGDLPGPRSWPLLGNGLSLTPDSLHQVLSQWADEYGTPYRLYLGRRKAVALADPELARQVMRDRPDGFTRFHALEAVAREMGVLGLFPAEGDSWKRQRRAWMQALNIHQVRPFFEHLTATTGRLLNHWQAAAERGDAVDVQADLMRYSVDVTTQFAFGYDANTLETGDGEMQRHMNLIFDRLNRRLTSPVAYWRWTPLLRDHKLDHAVQEVQRFAHRLIDQARDRIAANPELKSAPTNLIEALLVSRAEDGRPYSDEEVYGNAIVALLAGEDTTANTLAWIIHLLTQNPGVQRHLQTEADEVLGNSPLWDALDQARSLRFTDAVANEGMRLKPVAPLLVFCATRDCQLGALEVPKGCHVFLLNQYMASQESAYAEAQRFWPERWLAADASRIENQPPMPFGSGPRLCPGRNLALMEIKSVLAMIAKHFTLEDASDAPVGEKMAFTMVPTNLRVRFHRRA